MILLVAAAIIIVGFIAGLTHCAYRVNRIFDEKPVADYRPEPVRTYAMK